MQAKSISGPVRAALSTTERRKRAIVLLVALPLLVAVALGTVVGALAEHYHWGPVPLILVALAALVLATIAGRSLLRAALSVRRLQTSAWVPETPEPLRVEVSGAAPQ